MKEDIHILVHVAKNGYDGGNTLTNILYSSDKKELEDFIPFYKKTRTKVELEKEISMSNFIKKELEKYGLPFDKIPENYTDREKYKKPLEEIYINIREYSSVLEERIKGSFSYPLVSQGLEGEIFCVENLSKITNTVHKENIILIDNDCNNNICDSIMNSLPDGYYGGKVEEEKSNLKMTIYNDSGLSPTIIIKISHKSGIISLEDGTYNEIGRINIENAHGIVKLSKALKILTTDDRDDNLIQAFERWRIETLRNGGVSLKRSNKLKKN